MRWVLTLYGGKPNQKRIVLNADSADKARMMAVKEMKKVDARVFELEKID